MGAVKQRRASRAHAAGIHVGLPASATPRAAVAKDAWAAPEFRAWMDRMGYTLDAAAGALDISRRSIAGYRSGAWPVPRTVEYACRWLARNG